MEHMLTEAKVEELAFYIEVRAYDDGDSHRKYRAILQDLVDRDRETIQVSYDDSDSKETLERKSWSAKDVYSLESNTLITFLTEEGINFLARECQYANEDEMGPENYLLIKLFGRLDEMSCKMFIFPM